MAVKVLELPGASIDEQSIKFAEEIDALDGVVDVQLFPDSYTKEKYIGVGYKITVPSSSAMVSEANILYPQLRSRGINCGMRIVALPIQADKLTDAFTKDLLHALTYDPLYFALYRLRLPWYRQYEDLSYDEFTSVLEGDSIKIKDVAHLLNQNWLTKRTTRMRHSFGRNFGGNHYFELQEVQDDAPELGLKKGQAVAMFHTGCQGIQSVVRPDFAKQYFYQSHYTATQKGEEMYDAFFVAQGMLKRYTVAYREATQHVIDAALKKHYSGVSTCIIDRGHNTVELETVNGEDRLVYRHNAERLGKGEYAIVSGMYDYPSHIVVGLSGAETYYNTIDHGLGKILDKDPEKDEMNEHVRLYRYQYGIRVLGSQKHTVSVVKSSLAERYFPFMEEKRIAKKVVSLRPLLNMKYLK
jgi:RNA-splicing ligase RtcB